MSLNRNELEELMMMLDETFHYVKDGGNQHLAHGLMQQHSLVKNKLEEMDVEGSGVSITDFDEVPCHFCGIEYNKIVTTMQFDSGGGTGTDAAMHLIINGSERIAVTEVDGFSKDNSYHILFSCGNGHFQIKSYDEHEGIVFTNSNELMDEMTMYLNTAYEQSHELDRTFDDELLHFIKEFFKVVKNQSL